MDTARENITREVGSRIRYARKSRGMSMDELAQAIYKTRSAISKYENGQISVDIATLYDIANALKVTSMICCTAIHRILTRSTTRRCPPFSGRSPNYICTSSTAGSTAPSAP